MAVDFGLQGQVAIVTGSTSGIGHAMADALAAQGVNIVLNGLGEMTAIEKTRAELAEKHGVEVLYNGADMTKPGQIAEMVRRRQGRVRRAGHPGQQRRRPARGPDRGLPGSTSGT
jgi:NAD(P)-dependent dehydrogenase (short-subunit alcohol dehydrogenase family)